MNRWEMKINQAKLKCQGGKVNNHDVPSKWPDQIDDESASTDTRTPSHNSISLTRESESNDTHLKTKMNMHTDCYDLKVRARVKKEKQIYAMCTHSEAREFIFSLKSHIPNSISHRPLARKMKHWPELD